MKVAKKAGRLDNLRGELAEHPLPAGEAAIGHTRWATHGGPTDANAHPHVSYDGRVAVVHNGIIENFQQLRAELADHGVTPVSQTDTEVAAHQLALEIEANLPAIYRYWLPLRKPAVETIRNEGPKTGRNDDCPCGSGKKFKQCHGKLA